MKHLMIIFSFFVIAPLIAKEHPGFFCRIVKSSKKQNIIILDIGREENIRKNDYGLLSYHGQKISKIKLMQLSSTRSMWEVIETLNSKKLSTNSVFHFKFISAKKFTKDKGDLPLSEIKAKYKSPLPYPFDSKAKLLLAIESGSRYRSDFDYSLPAQKGNHGQRFQGSLAWIWRSDLDHRIYWGPAINLQHQKNNFKLIDQTKIIEGKKRISLGPYMQVLFWGNTKYSISGHFQFMANLDQLQISHNSIIGLENNAKFSGLSFGHSAGIHWAINYLMGKSHLTIGVNAQTDYPHTLKGDNIQNNAFFPENTVDNRTHTNFLFRLGLHIPIWI